MVFRMVKRLFWVLVGVAIGIYVWRKVQAVAHAYSPSGIAERAQSSAERTTAGLQNFFGTVRAIADSKETELRKALADATPASAVTAGQPRRRRGDGRELRDIERRRPA